jgi:VWA domain-containing protein
MILLLLTTFNFFQVEPGPSPPTFREYILEAANLHRSSDHGADDRVQFWEFLADVPSDLQPSRSNLRLLREIVRQEGIVPWLLHGNSSMKELPGELEFLKDSVLIWSLFELDLRLRPFAPPSSSPKLTALSRPVDFAEVLARAIREQTNGLLIPAANHARQIFRSSWAPSQFRELAEIILRATDPTIPLPTDPLEETIEGKFTFFLFRTRHPYTKRLESDLRKVKRAFEASELAFKQFPIGISPYGDDWGEKWPAEVGPRALAELFGCHLLPQAILVDPDGIPVARWKYSKWQDPNNFRGPRKIHPWITLIRQGLGFVQFNELQKLRGSSSWSEFRNAWRALRKDSPSAYSPKLLLNRARFFEKPFLGILLLAAEGNHPPPLIFPREPKSLHERLVIAWYQHQSESPGAWPLFLEKALQRRSGISPLELADALLDLGIPSKETEKILFNLASDNSDWVLRSIALRALEFQETTKSPQKLAKSAKNRIWQVRLAMTEALRGFHHVDAVPILITLMDDDRLRIRLSAVEGLRELTGASMGTTPAECLAWWDEHKIGFKFPNFLLRKQRTPRSNAPANATVSYFGLDLRSDHVLFLVDRSESMLFFGKWAGLIDELSTFLENSPKTFHFNIAEFSDHPKKWERKLQPLNKRKLKDAMSHIRRSAPYGPTNLWDTFVETFEGTDADTVVLLSDGEANRGDLQEPEEILEGLRTINRYTRLRIHTVYMWYGIAIPYKEDHSCSKNCPAPREIDPESWKEEKRQWLSKTVHGSMLTKIAADTDGIATIGFGKPWHQLPP